MLRIIYLILLSFFVAGSKQKTENTTSSKVVSLETKTIVNVFFPTDGGRWTDLIVSSYVQQLTMIKPSLNFVNVSWTKGADLKTFLENIVSAKPDIVFLPDDLLYLQLGPEIEKVTKAKIVFITFYSDRKGLDAVVKNSIGVVAEAPVQTLLKNAQLLAGAIRSVGIVGGPYAEKIIGHIKGKLGDVKVESFHTASWSEYSKKIKEFSENCDALWPLAAFGVVNADGMPVTDSQLNALIDEFPKISLGYGRISGFRRTIDMDIDPVTLGKNAAALTFSYMRGETVGISDFTSYEMRINDSHLKRLKFKVHENLKEFVYLR